MNFDEMVKPRGAETRAAGRSAAGSAIGGSPQVSLLPAELRNAVRDRALKHIMVMVLAGVIGLTAGGVGLAYMLVGTAQTRYDAESTRAQTLATQIAKFGPVSKLQKENLLGEAGVKVGSSTLIDWQAQFDAIEQYMPDGFTVTTVTADSASPIVDYPQPTAPLELPRAATVQLTADSKDITGLPHWLRMIRQIPAYADATAAVTHDDTTGYSVQITVHLSAKAIDKDAWKEWVK